MTTDVDDDLLTPRELGTVGIANAVPWMITGVGTAVTSGVSLIAAGAVAAGAGVLYAASRARSKDRSRSGRSGRSTRTNRSGKSGHGGQQARSGGPWWRGRRANGSKNRSAAGTNRSGSDRSKNRPGAGKGDTGGKNRSGTSGSRSGRSRSGQESRSSRARSNRGRAWTPGISTVDLGDEKKTTTKKANKPKSKREKDSPMGTNNGVGGGAIAQSGHEFGTAINARINEKIDTKAHLGLYEVFGDLADGITHMHAAMTDASSRINESDVQVDPSVKQFLAELTTAIGQVAASAPQIQSAMAVLHAQDVERVQRHGGEGLDAATNRDQIP